ncbi:MAG TPA: type III pantothenate kinase [Lentisphaeria bacterium]|jgi:type III pantothenate kinase|nr:type III pantothenate kinase [Lentisphaerota bacterium]OQC17185.1 MAG: Type III pantothenate kinase [Lentisphaerae bacterium ADurb.Bin082]HPY89251.1 type III pantothenate kinase [Lentisphaeria bacterium]HQC52530.1 type III pantothenate kinase [Lentisphaeria bacterium]
MQRLLLNIGNTHIQVATLTGHGPELLVCYDTPDIRPLEMLPALESMTTPWDAWAVSVVPPVRLSLEQRYGRRIRFLTPKDFPQLDFSPVDTSTLGMDRIANAAAARSLTNSAVIVLDCGTAITTEALDSQGRFRGGAILPGRMLQRKTLAAYTAQLPLIPLGQDAPAALGCRTTEAIAAGIDRGIVGAVREIVAATRRELESADCPVLVTGGDAPFFTRHLPELTPAPDLFTLRGIATAKPAV